MWKLLISLFFDKIFGAISNALQLWIAKRAREKLIKEKAEALKNAKTIEEQERASAELIRVTTGG